MADFDLIVGVDSTLSYGPMRKGISEAIKQINENPPKIKIDVDEQSKQNIKSFASEIKSELKGLNLKGGKGKVFGDIQTEIANMSTSLESLKTEISSVGQAFKSIKGININLGLGGGDQKQRDALYKQQTKRTLESLQAEAKELEAAFLKVYQAQSNVNVDGMTAVLKQLKTAGVAKNDILDTLRIINTPPDMDPKITKSMRMDAWKSYIGLMRDLANVRGIDISGVMDRNASALVSSTEKIATGESHLEFVIEKIKNLFGSGISSDALAEQINTIVTAIDRVVEAVSKISIDKDAFGSLTNSVQTSTTAVNGLVEALNRINEASLHSKALSSNLSMEREAKKSEAELQTAHDKLGTYSTKIDEIQRKLSTLSAPSEDLTAAFNRLKSLYSTIESTNTTDADKIAAYKDWAVEIEHVNSLLAHEINLQKDTSKYAFEDAKKGINQYYSLLTNLTKSGNKGVTLTDLGWKANSSEYESLASALNSAAIKLRLIKESMQSLPVEQQTALMELLTNRTREYELVLGEQAAKEHEAAAAAKEAAAAAQERAKEKVTAKQDATLDEMHDKLGTYSARIDEIKRKLGTLSSPSEKLTSAFGRLNSLYNTMASTSTSEADKVRAYNDWANAITEVNALLTTEINLQREEAKNVQKPVSQKAVLDQATSLKSLLGTGSGASGTQAYKEVERWASQLDAAIKNANGDAAKLQQELANIGINGAADFERVAEAAARLRNEMAGVQKPVSQKAVIDQATSLKSLLGSSAGISDTQAYRDVENWANLLDTAIKNANGDAEKLQQELASIGINGSKDFERVAEAAAKLRHEMAGSPMREGTQQYDKALRRLDEMQSRIQKNASAWSAARNGKSSQAYADYLKQADAVDALRQKMAAGQITAVQYEAEVTKIGASMARNENIIRRAGEATRSMSDRLKGIASRLSAYFGISQIIMYSIRAVREAASASIQLERSFAQLKIVTGATDAEMVKFKDTAVGLAKDLGKSVSDVAGSIEVFSRLGYSLPDASELAKYATVMANVAAVDTDAATTGLTSIIKGFDMDVDNAEHVSDVLVKVGQEYAVSAGEMMTAFEKSGAALNATGTSFEKSAGLIAAANAAVQDASVVGTALKTVSARIRGSKTELDELGEGTEDLAEGFSKYAAELKGLTGFDIMNGDHTFKDLYDIFEGISRVWDKLSDTQRARVSEILGGTRQLQVISSVLGNWEDAAGAYAAAMDSAGAATRANDIYMSTAEAHINQMKAAFQEMGSTVFDSSIIAFGADFVSFLLNAVSAATKLVDALGGVKTILAAIVALNINSIASSVTTMLGTLTVKLTQLLPTEMILNIATSISKGSTIYKAFVSEVLSGSKSISAAFSGIGKGIKSWFGGLPTLTKVSMGITGLIAVISLVNTAIDAYKRKIQEARNAEMEKGKASTDEAKNLAELYSAYRDAKAAYDGSADSKNALSSASANLAKALGVEEEKVNSLSDSYKEMTLNQLRAAEGDARAAIVAARGNLNSALDGKENGDARTLSALVASSLGKELNTGDSKRDAQTLMEVYDELIARRDAMIKAGQEETSAYLINSQAIDLLRPNVEALVSAESDLNEIMDLLGDTAFNTSDSIDSVGNSASKASGSFKDLFAGNVSESIDSVQNKIASLSEALTNLESGSMGVEDVIDLLQQFPELAEYVDLTADGFGNLDVGLKRVISDAPKELINTLNEFKRTHDLTEAQTRQIDSLSDALRNLPEDSVSSLSEEFGVLADNIRKAGEARTELQKKLEEEDYDAGYDERVKNFDEFQKTLEAGEYGSKAYAAYKEYFGLVGQTSDEVQAWADANAKYFKEGEEGISAWVQTLSELTKSGALEGIASYDEETGLFTYDVTKMDEFAAKLGWTEEMLQDFISKYRMYVEEWESYSGSDLMNMFTNAGLLGSAPYPESGAVASMSKLMEYTGKTKEEVQELIDKINQDLPDAQLKGIDDSFLSKFSKTGFGTSMDEITTDMMNLKSVIQSLGIDWNEFVENGFENFDTTLQPLLEGLGWTEEEIDALRDKLRDPFEIAMSTVGTDSLDEVIKKLHHYNIDVSVDASGGLVVTQQLVDDLYAATGSAEETLAIINQLADRPDVTVEAGLTLEENSIEDLIGADDTATVTVDLVLNGEPIKADITAVASDIQTILGDAGTVTLTGDSTDVNTKIELLQQLLDGLPNAETPAVVSVNGETTDAVTSLQSVIDQLAKIKSKSITITTTYNDIHPRHAKGTKHAKRGPALLGDEYSPTGKPKPELVVSKDSAYVAGVNGPVVSNLEDGDVVYTADETKKILKGSNIVRLPAFAGGTANGLKRKGSSGASVSSYSGASSKATTASAKQATNEVSEAVEDQLKELKEKIDDILEQFEFDIFMAEQHNASAEQIITIYKRMQQTVHEQAEKYRSMGVDENNEYIRDLKKQWWEYEESIREARKKEFDEWVKDSQFAIEVMEHDEDGVDKILDSWRTILRSINDEIAYYSAQGYDITSDEIQDLMKEAWDAEEQIEEILDKVLDKVNDDIDKIQDVFKTLRSAADEWDASNFLTLDTLQEIINLGVEYMACLKEENGMLFINREAIANMLAAKAQELAVQAALNYVRRIGNALQEGETEELNRLLSATMETTNATWGLVYANLAFLKLTDDQYDKAVTNIDRLRSIADNVSANISNSLNDDNGADTIDNAKEGLEKIIEYTKDLIKHEHDDMAKALDDQLDKYKKIVDEKKKSLDLTKSELDYNKDISNRTTEIAKLQAQADALALDDSREAQIKRAKILEEIAKKQEELEEKQRDHSIDAQKDALDKQGENFEESVNEQKEALENEISSEEKLYQLAIQRIKDSGLDALKDQLIAWNTEYGNSLNSEIVDAWNAAKIAVDAYGGAVEDALKGSGLTEDGKVVSDQVGTKHDYNSNDAREIARAMEANSLAWFTASSTERKRLEAENAKYASQLQELGLYRQNGAWYREDGSLLYALDTAKVDQALAAAMKQNSIAWWTASPAERTQLANKNKELAGYSGGRITNKNGTWVGQDGKPLYTITAQEKEAIVHQLVAMMKNNSGAWASADATERKRLSEENVRLANSVGSLLGAKITRGDDGVWMINGEKLYDKYHSGGVVGGGTIKDRERFALLNKGEMVLSDTQKQSLEHLLAVGQMLRDKSSLLADSVFGGMVNNIAASSMKGIRNQLPGEINKPTQVVQVDASLTVSGAVDDDVLRVIKKYPRIVAEQVSKVLV